MYNADQIVSDFITNKIVTLRRSTGDFPVEDILVDRSSSGYKFQAHPYVSIEGLDDLKERNTIQTWSATPPSPYQIDEVVKDGSNNVYQSLINNNTDALTVTTSWRPTTEISIQHRKRVYEAVVDVLNRSLVIPEVRLSERIEIPYNPNLVAIQSDNHRVGLCIYGISEHVKLKLRLALQLTGNETVNFQIKDQNNVLFTDTINATTGVNYKDTEYELSGRGPFFITYDQSTVTNNGTFTFSPFDTEWFSVNGVHTTKTDFTLIDAGDFFNYNYGWNYEITVQSDLTSYIIQNISQLAEAVSLQYAYNFLESALTNPHVRANRTQRNYDRDLIMVELKDEKINNLNKRLYRAIGKLKKSFANRIDKATEEYETINWEVSF